MCLLNRGQRDEDALLAAFNTTHGGNSGTSTGGSGSASVYERPRFGTKNLFLVHHFAGSVTYSVTSWLDKNNDALQEDLLSLLMCSNNSFIQNAIVAVGMRTSDGENNITSGAEGQLGYVKEISEERLVAGVVEARAGQAQAGGEPRIFVCIFCLLIGAFAMCIPILCDIAFSFSTYGNAPFDLCLQKRCPRRTPQRRLRLTSTTLSPCAKPAPPADAPV